MPSFPLLLCLHLEPINIFFGVYKTDNAPIRLSYHGRIHYNSVVDPCAATIGVGLGLAGHQPGVRKTLDNECVIGRMHSAYSLQPQFSIKCLWIFTMVTASNVRPFSSRASIVKSCSQTTKNKATLPHNNLISVQCLHSGVLVHSHWYHSPSTLDDFHLL